MVRHCLLLILAAAASVATLGAQAFSCPATISVTEQAQAPAGWNAPPAKTEHAFQTVKVYNGAPGKEEYDLRPDDESQKGRAVLQTWNLKDYRTMNLFARCYYYDTKATITADIPAALSKCSISFTLTANGAIVGKSSMKCE